jgi:hypothetical protein
LSALLEAQQAEAETMQEEPMQEEPVQNFSDHDSDEELL